MSKIKIIVVIIILIFFISYLLCGIWGEDIYMLLTPKVKAKGIGAAIWDDKKYHNVINVDDLYTDDGSYYVYTIKTKSSYWYSTYYIIKENVDVLSRNGSEVAIDFLDQNVYEGGIIVSEFVDECKEGAEVYVIFE